MIANVLIETDRLRFSLTESSNLQVVHVASQDEIWMSREEFETLMHAYLIKCGHLIPQELRKRLKDRL